MKSSTEWIIIAGLLTGAPALLLGGREGGRNLGKSARWHLSRDDDLPRR